VSRGPSLKAAVERRAGHLVFGSRRWLQRQIAGLAPEFAGRRVLEIGSGRNDLGAEAYSMHHYFPAGTDFVKSDVNPAYGHLVVDITTMALEAEYDLILCLSVLEHVPNFWTAPARLHSALRPGGTLVVSTPMNFPYHDEPADFYRFTTYGLQAILSDFSEVELRHRGPRRLPFTVMAVARK
jgi:2-polyprenyl-3-methyl-5-hydroxy-6-metoxy-1,4-benzoquinol methylase